jgi:hypothetical protein
MSFVFTLSRSSGGDMLLNTDERTSIRYAEMRDGYFGGCTPFVTAIEYITLRFRPEAKPLW